MIKIHCKSFLPPPIDYDVMDSFECPCERTINATHFLFNTEYAMVNTNDIYQLHDNLGVIKGARSRRDIPN